MASRACPIWCPCVCHDTGGGVTEHVPGTRGCPSKRNQHPHRRPDGRPMTRLTVDAWALALATTVATRADCTRRQVGCVILDADHRVIATGYNGAPAGDPGCASAGACPRGQLTYAELAEHTDYDTGPGRCHAIHAEMNALLWAGTSCAGATVYITHPPCPGCAKHLRAARVARVVFPGAKDGVTLSP